MKYFSWILLVLAPSILSAQVDEQASSAEIYGAMQKLQNTATVLYVAAHPDDENTRLISWFSNHKHANTVYLSLTRGDGGQNLIGAEKGPLLGLLRTQELLEARKIDGGRQFFSRANDFGYSKTATETLEFWDEAEILADVVWAIRKWQPDIIINRFDHDSNGKTHGHHTASAVLGLEAFRLAGDPNVFPEQLKYVSPWQPARIYFNTSWWFYGSREAFEEADKSDMAEVDIGTYDALSGRSNNEIAAQSRSMHKCQGFGSEASRGTQTEYLQFLMGERPADRNDVFDGIDNSWGRVAGGQVIGEAIQAMIDAYDFTAPHASLPALLDICKKLEVLPGTPLTNRKLKEVAELIRWCAGLYIEVTAGVPSATPGDSITLSAEVVLRSPVQASVQHLYVSSNGIDIDAFVDGEEVLAHNVPWEAEQKFRLPESLSYSTPYWLEEPSPNPAMYAVSDQALRGQPESDPVLFARAAVSFNGQPVELELPVNYKQVDPAVGEIYQPLAVLPPVVVEFGEPVYIFRNSEPGQVRIRVRAVADGQNGTASLMADGWSFHPAVQHFQLEKAGSGIDLTFEVKPPAGPHSGPMKAILHTDRGSFELALNEVNYDHINYQSVLQPAQANIVNIDVAVAERKVAYLPGSGDEVPAALEQLGMDVTILEKDAWKTGALDGFDVAVLGIRSFNVHPELSYFADEIWKFAEKGGLVVVQYNTSRGLEAAVSPLPLRLSRERITEEDAPLTMLDPQHPIFQTPNKITPADFDGWVQERGLYFADEWSEEFTPLLRGHDTGEEPSEGMLLVAPYGKGHYVFTGLSFFRELPAGVPGAYRLFANILSLE